MPASYRRQAVIDAPLEEVWELVGDPKRHPEWFPMVMEVSGLPSVETDATFRQVTRTVGGKIETTMAVEELDDLRQISLRCTDTGTYTRWWLTEGQGSTFVDMEIGLEPASMFTRLFDVTVGGRYCRRWTEDALDGLREAAATKPQAPA